MADTLTPKQRSALMAKIKGRDTRPEKVVRSLLHSLGARFRLNRRDLPGTPDIVLPGRRLVIFVHGCFWHRHGGCRGATSPQTRRKFWQTKFAANQARDARVAKQLRKAGWRVMIVWECQTKPSRMQQLQVRLAKMLATTSPM